MRSPTVVDAGRRDAVHRGLSALPPGSCRPARNSPRATSGDARPRLGGNCRAPAQAIGSTCHLTLTVQPRTSDVRALWVVSGRPGRHTRHMARTTTTALVMDNRSWFRARVLEPMAATCSSTTNRADRLFSNIRLGGLGSVSTIRRSKPASRKFSERSMNDEPVATNVDSAMTESFADVVLPHLDAAYRLARWLTRNEHDAEDIVQEASLRRPGFRTFTGGNGRAWFLRIVRNTCHGWRAAGRQAATDPFDEERHTSDRTCDPESLALQTDDVRLVQQAMRFVPDRHRQLLCPPGAGRAVLSRARRRDGDAHRQRHVRTLSWPPGAAESSQRAAGIRLFVRNGMRAGQPHLRLHKPLAQLACIMWIKHGACGACRCDCRSHPEAGLRRFAGPTRRAAAPGDRYRFRRGCRGLRLGAMSPRRQPVTAPAASSSAGANSPGCAVAQTTPVPACGAVSVT